MDQEYNQRFSGQPGSSLWIKDEIAKERFIYWIKGQTGFDIVDAAMHQIHKTGWMHNRARMIVGSFLSKNLGVDWRWGQNFFRILLVDLDEASNNGGWQWSASVGADPKPIRIFNPFIQAEKFDPKGEYRQFWLPSDYLPYPIVDYKTSREQAILRYKIK
jgi:deoxyribodipyrimidine photo-lyase